MVDDLSHQIKVNKDKLRKKSKNYYNNFYKIENFIKSEIKYIVELKKSGKTIIPEIDFKDLNLNNDKIIKDIYKRGCLIIRNVFSKDRIRFLNLDLEYYIKNNGYYSDQKHKVGLDSYFSDLKSGKPQIFGLYWSKTQFEIN